MPPAPLEPIPPRGVARAGALVGDPRRLAVVAALLAALVYLPHVGNDWIWDEHGFYVGNPTVNGTGPWLDVLTKDMWWAHRDTQGPRMQYYRPAYVALCRVLWAAGGGTPAAFRLAALVAHLAAALLAARLLRGLGAGAAAAAVAALAFLVHPLAAETVLFANGEAWLLALGLAALLALRAGREAADPRARRGWQAAGFAFTLLALGFKESAVIVPALAALEAVLGPRDGRRARLAATLPAWLALAPWLAARTLLLERAPETALIPAFDDPLARLARAGEILAWHLRRLAFPFPLSPVHQLPPAAGRAFGLGVLAAVAAGLAIAAWRRPRALGWAVALLLPLAPLVAQVFLARETGMPVAERYVYLSLLPVVAAAVLAAARLARVAAARGAPRAASAVALAAALAIPALATATARYGRHYDGDAAYFGRALAVYPDNPLALSVAAQQALTAGDPREAARLFEAAARAEPRYALSHLNVAIARRRLGDVAAAEAAARTAVALDPELPVAHRVLADLYRDSGRLGEAGPHYRALARLLPRDPAARADLGTWLWLQGDAAGAVAEWEAGLAAAPDSCELLFDLAMGRARLGPAASARELAARFLARCGEGWEAQRAQARAWADGAR